MANMPIKRELQKNYATVCMFKTIDCVRGAAISFFVDTDFFWYNRKAKPASNQ
jgi:hypothetical protein